MQKFLEFENIFVLNNYVPFYSIEEIDEFCNKSNCIDYFSHPVYWGNYTQYQSERNYSTDYSNINNFYPNNIKIFIII